MIKCKKAQDIIRLVPASTPLFFFFAFVKPPFFDRVAKCTVLRIKITIKLFSVSLHGQGIINKFNDEKEESTKVILVAFFLKN